jgi:hypothetical protein
VALEFNHCSHRVLLAATDDSPDLDAIFDNDVTMDSFLKAFQDDPGLPLQNANDAFKIKN